MTRLQNIKLLSLVVTVALCISSVCGSFVNSPLSKCDDNAIYWIKVLWKAFGVPSDIISRRAKDEKVGIVLSSNDYDAQPLCQTIEFSGTSSKWITTNNQGEKSEYTEKIKEDEGVVSTLDESIQRHFVFSRGGVNAYYVCSPDGPEGDFEGAVTATYDKIIARDSDTFDLINVASMLMDSVGIFLNLTSVETCFSQ